MRSARGPVAACDLAGHDHRRRRRGSRLNAHLAYRLIVSGTGPECLTDTSGRALDGAGIGRPGGNYTASIDPSILVVDRSGPGADAAWQLIRRWRRRHGQPG